MAAKTLDEFYKEYRAGFNPITGKPNLYQDLTDQHIWDAAMTAANASKLPQADIDHAFRAGHMAGGVHCPVDLAWKEWQLREGTQEADTPTNHKGA